MRFSAFIKQLSKAYLLKTLGEFLRYELLVNQLRTENGYNKL